MPRLENPHWAYLAGLFGGMLGGAYNTSGPPVIMYADCRRWPPDVFKGNLQGYFIIVSLAVVVSHALSGNFTFQVWQIFLSTLPFTVLGIACIGGAWWLSRTVDKAESAFKQAAQATELVKTIEGKSVGLEQLHQDLAGDL